jgi:hypothetical protein
MGWSHALAAMSFIFEGVWPWRHAVEATQIVVGSRKKNGGGWSTLR